MTDDTTEGDIVERLLTPVAGDKDDVLRELFDRTVCAADEIGRLRAGIRAVIDGSADIEIYRIKKHDTCRHDNYRWEGCQSCVDDYLQALLEPKSS